MLEVTLRWTGNSSGGGGRTGVVILLVMLKWNRDKFRLSGSLGSTMEPRKASFNLVKLPYGCIPNKIKCLVIGTLYIEELPSESWKTKPKLLKQPIRRTVYIIICQRELKVKTSKLLREKEKGEWASCKCNLASDRLRGWLKFSGPINEQSSAKFKQSRMSFINHQILLFRQACGSLL